MTAKDAIIELVKCLKDSNFLTPSDEHAILIALDRRGAS
ncbi:hypothetical protein ES702_02581 [subsurface metagenome]